MTRKTIELENRTPRGKLNFCVILQGNTIGERKTANSVDHMIEIANKKWEVLEFRNDDGQRIRVSREWMEPDPVIDFEGWTADEVIQDWLENATQDDFDERITAMGQEWGTTLEW